MYKLKLKDKNQYILLLNDTLKSHIVTLNRGEKKRLREKFEFLENGIWDSGVRVKKLRGVSGKVIFEARLSKGNRIIFTLGKHGSQTAIYLWGIVKHDDIGTTAQRVFPNNAPFLGFEPENIEDYPDILIDELPEENFSQEDIEEKSPNDYGPQKWLVLNDEEWRRMLLSTDTDNFDIFLFLTSEQNKILETNPPLLLSGTAGSGKTTISVYYLLKKDFINKKRLFLTYSPYLKEFSEKIYTGLTSCTDLEKSDMKPDFYVFGDLLQDIVKASGLEYKKDREVRLREFVNMFRRHKLHQKYDAELVWEEIRSIIKGAKPPINIVRYRKLLKDYIRSKLSRRDLNELKDYLLGLKGLGIMDKIERIMDRKTKYSIFDDFVQDLTLDKSPSSDEHIFILGEILRIIEKKAKNFSTPLLSYQEYLSIGKKRAPNFIYERKDIYEIAEYYQGKLEEHGQWDEIDLCRQAIQLMDKQANRFSYDLVVCDEVQDFADIQLSLIFRLAKSYKGIIFSGDPKQIINPSGFRWEEVKNRFYERGVHIPDVYQLNLNFRCVGNIVRLSNALLDLKKQLIGISGSELREDWKFNGRPPFLLTGISEKEILNRIHLTGAGRIILVRNKGEQRKLKHALHTELVFTIYEAKGLEFDTVLLWKFSSDKKSADIWRRIKNDHYFDRSHYPHIKHEINLLYVAITRARNTLILFDSSYDVWDIDTFHDLLYRTGKEDVLSEIWQKVSTPEEWEKQGDYFFQREYYPAAAECYKNSGNIARAEIARAFIFEEKKQFSAAAKLFEKHGFTQKAAENYQGAGIFNSAILLWEKLKNNNRVRICRISLYEQNGEYNKAAEEWLRLKDAGKALENWKKAGNNLKIAEYYYSGKKYKKAAEEFEKANNYELAALCYNKEGQFDKSADLFYKSGNFKKAAQLYKKLKNREKLLSCYKKLKDYYNAALLYEKDKDIDRAISYFRDFTLLSDENRKMLIEEAEKYSTKYSKLKSAIRFSALSMPDRSAQIFFDKRQYRKALDEFRIIKNHERAAECLFNLDDYYGAALEYEKIDEKDKWERVITTLKHYIYYEKYNKTRADKLFKEAESFFNDGSYDRALVRYKAVNYSYRIYDTYLKLDRDEEALSYFLEYDMVDSAINYLEEKKNIAISTDFMRFLVSKYDNRCGWFGKDREDTDVIARLFRILLKRQKDQESLNQLDRFLSSFSCYFIDENYPKSFFDLALWSKHYNTILEILKSRNFKKGSMPGIYKSFIKDIERKVEQEKDESLLACYLFLHNPNQYENLLEKLNVTEWNYKLFVESKRHYQKAVNYLKDKNEIEKATRTCRQYGNFGLAAQIYEGAGDYKSAAKDYREGKIYEDSIRCYKKVGDKRGIARVYERMREFDKAIAIWKRLGKSREVSRVLKKKAKEIKEKTQMGLFN
ncbi:MAG TPA: hypothetical protein DHW42_04985 [Candidatus Marinimicrobia bacterium]|nr:hypothetical protein [Candidatus Neomarinimicrobiota bacterium]